MRLFLSWFRWLVLRRRRWLVVVLLLAGMLAFGWWRWLGCWRDEWVRDIPCSTVFLDRDGEVLLARLGRDERWRFPVPLGEVSPLLVDALVAVEDQHFYAHGGVDWPAVVRAGRSNLTSGRVVSGASTITMQVVRLARPGSRGWFGKLVQASRAWDLERQHGKDWIMEQYLNLLPFGGNLVGVEAAAQCYLGKHVGHLTLAEAALLAGLPQRPNHFRPDRHPEAAVERRKRVLERMEIEGMVSAEDAAQAAGQVLPVVARTAGSRIGIEPREPQYCQLASRVDGPRETVRTALDSRRQQQVLAALQAGVARTPDVADGAAVLLAVPTGDVLALVGTLDYARPGDGQVNAATAPRSPGSALKPLLYAVATRGGRMVPDTVLADAPLALPDYRPDNFDQRFRGPVSMGDALRDSLNTPAVRTLQATGVAPVLDLLHACGVASLRRSAEEYGLSLALGGGEVSPLELAVAYAVLARGGEFLPPRFRLDSTRQPVPQRVLPVGVASLLSDVLSERALPGLPPRWVAWKTGTSNGLRDAWCVAYNREMVLVVWLGNKSGAPSPGLVGVQTAVPVAADVLQRLFADHAPLPPDTTTGVVDIALCADTGLRATPGCQQQRQGRAVAGIPLLACGGCAPKPSLAILSPRPGVYRADGTGVVQLPLTSTGGTGVAWFVDGAWVGTPSSSQRFAPGHHVVRCVSGDGQLAATVNLEVQGAN